MVNDKFCIRCGAILPEGSSFCPECGADVIDSTTRPKDEGQPTQQHKVVNNGNRSLSPIPSFIIIYGILAVIGSIFVLVFALNMESMIVWLESMIDVIKESSPEYAQELMNLIKEYRSIGISVLSSAMITTALFMLASGVCAIVSGYFADHLVKWKLSYILCFIASILPVAGMSFVEVPLIIVGLFMTYRLYKARDLFES